MAHSPSNKYELYNHDSISNDDNILAGLVSCSNVYHLHFTIIGGWAFFTVMPLTATDFAYESLKGGAL